MRHRILSDPDPVSTLRAVRGPAILPIRAAMRVRSDPAGFALELRQRYGDLSVLRVMGRDIVVAQGPELASELVRDADRAFANEPVYGFALGSLFERGILLMDNDEHRRHRRIMQQAFTSDRLDDYQCRIHGLAEAAMERFPRGSVDMRAELKALALDIALDVFAGQNLSRADANRINKAFVELIEAGGALVRMPIPGSRWHRGHRARRVVDDFFGELLPQRRRNPGSDLMSALCEARDADGEQLSDERVVDHMRFMLFAAHDTATIAMTSMAYRLGRNPLWRDRLRAEAESAGRAPSLAQLRDSDAMQWVFKESLRLRPPVPVIPRAAIKDTSLGGYHIPAGTFVIVVTGSNHRLDDVWAEPESFVPERFSADEEKRRHRLAWMPFGGGAHQCIGMHFSFMEAATVLHHMLRHLDWSVPSADYEHTDTALTTNLGFTAEVRGP